MAPGLAAQVAGAGVVETVHHVGHGFAPVFDQQRGMSQHHRASIAAAPPALGGAGQLAALQGEVEAAVAKCARHRAYTGLEAVFRQPQRQGFEQPLIGDVDALADLVTDRQRAGQGDVEHGR